MSIPDFALFVGRQKDEFPPTTKRPLHDSAFQASYIGSNSVYLRVRRAMKRYAITQAAFWSFPLFEAAVIIVGLIFIAPALSPLATILIVLLISGAGCIVPFRILHIVGEAARQYATSGEKYSATITDTTIYWRTPSSEYEIPLTSVAKFHRYHGVVILRLKSSRAIAVLPIELVETDRVHNLARLSGVG